MRRLGVPKAHALSPRSLEIVRQLGLPVSAIRQLPAHRRDAMWVRFVTNLSGQQVGCLPYERMSLDVLDASPEVSLLWGRQLFSICSAIRDASGFPFHRHPVTPRATGTEAS